MKERIKWIDDLRVLACFAVIMIHVIAGWTDSVNNLQLTNFRWFIDNVLFQVLIKYAVPVFIMISGYLLLNPQKEIGFLRIKKYVLRMVAVICIFGTGFSLIENILNYGMNNILCLFFKSFLDALQGNSWAHLWYVYLIIGLYLLTPVIKVAINNLKENEIKFILAVLFVFSFVIPSFNNICGLNITTFFIGNEIFSYIFYYVMGYYIGNKKLFNERLIYISGVLGIIGFIALCIIKRYGIYVPLINSNVFICLYSILIFKLFSNNIIKIPDFKFKNFISDYSFGIYIIHPFWINLLNKGLGIYPDILPCIIGEILFFIYALVFSIFSVYIIKRVPIIKKII